MTVDIFATTASNYELWLEGMIADQKHYKKMNAYVVFLRADEGDVAIKFYEVLKPSDS